MGEPPSKLLQVRDVKVRYQDELMQKPNVVGVGIGIEKKRDRFTGQIVLVVNVRRKVPCETLPPDGCIPEELDGVRVDVQEIGDVVALEEKEG